MAEQKLTTPLAGCKEAVCINADRVYDSCCERDCLEDMRVFFTHRGQEVIDQAMNVRLRSAEIIKVLIDVEPVSFNRGFFACDLTFFFLVRLDVFTSAHGSPEEVCGVTVFDKKVILFGSEGSVKIFSSEFAADADDEQMEPSHNAPKCIVEAVEPVALSARLADESRCCCEQPCRLPRCVSRRLGGDVADPQDCDRGVRVTLGLFIIVQLVRKVSILIPVIDFCVPEKECESTADNPCEAFRRIGFPLDEFFPPREGEMACPDMRQM